jgi:hypothetical protein
MIKNRLYIIPLTALLFTACNFGKPKKTTPDITRDTLSYTYQTVKERATDCGNKPDTGCTVAQIKYPVFENQSALNDTLTQRFLTIELPGNRPADDPQKQAKNFIADYEKFYADKRRKGDKKIPFASKTYAKVIRQDSSLVNIEMGGYSFAGGAHGGSLTLFLNWNTKTEKPIALEDIFRKGYEKDFNAIAERIFRKQENLTDTSSLARDYFFKDNKFALNNNFLITPVGIRFLYNQYEIKPYAAGTTDLFIPYTLIQHLLKPGTVVAQYIKH